MAKYCSQCGGQLATNNKYCTHCGYKIKSSANSSAIQDIAPQNAARQLKQAKGLVTRDSQGATAPIIATQRASVARSDFFRSLLISIGLLALAGVITGVSYSLAEPGGTYTVTTGLFLFGGINMLLTVTKFFQWVGAAIKAR